MDSKSFKRIYDSVLRGGIPALIGYDLSLKQLNSLLPIVKNKDYAEMLKCKSSEFLTTKTT